MAKKNYKIKGMHCQACEVWMERRFRKISGVKKVEADYATGIVKVTYDSEPSVLELNNSIKDAGYSVVIEDEINRGSKGADEQEKTDYLEVVMYFIIVLGIYAALKPIGILPHLSLTDNMSYGFIFLLGIVAAFSTCLAVSGGLLLAVAAKYNEMHSSLTGWQKFKPNIYFNIGRIFSYTFFGFVIGAFGSVLTLFPFGSGVLTIIVSIVMVLLGFQLLNLFPWLRRFQPKMPKFIGHKVHDISSMESKSAPFMLGAGTFFLPCGFTMALQLYVLSKGSAVVGALAMLAFSLGTLPTL